ncbi:2-amino-4-hydroxy-6-hydroxymethyldihydropteridine diphosphokinase [Solirhodobacter olei]|uniref:2-amino-4-hydroxy-6- hydroxymethyldihydropteridine diphosphokinase n=1 Tax=Solirhodobacter olei TaxID=2493082 RepID=UPI000FDBFE81|nr:2-amino-4-hydroxy-6-hydroxymethyldihydropteridine diphosphokinase [Solirhodobacter olei]
MTKTQVTPVLIALGANLPSAAGGPERTIPLALQEISKAGLEVVACSRFYDTPAFPDPSDPAYLNAVAAIATDLEPGDVLARLHRVEALFGRERIQRWGVRTLDLDLVAYGERVLPDLAGFTRWQRLPPEERVRRAPEELILPHPRLAERAFVLVPMAEIAPDWRHPVLGLTTAEMLARLPQEDRDAVRPRADG